MLATALYKYVEQWDKGSFHEYLYSSAKNITKNETLKSLQTLGKDSDIVVLTADKESSTVILNECYYIKKVNDMIKWFTWRKCVKTTYNLYNDLKRFQEFNILSFL